MLKHVSFGFGFNDLIFNVNPILNFDEVALFKLVDHDRPIDNLSKLCLNIKSLAYLKISFINILNPCYHQKNINSLGLISQLNRH